MGGLFELETDWHCVGDMDAGLVVDSSWQNGMDFVDRSGGLRSYAWGMDSSWQTGVDGCLEVAGCLHLVDPSMRLRSSSSSVYSSWRMSGPSLNRNLVGFFPVGCHDYIGIVNNGHFLIFTV